MAVTVGPTRPHIAALSALLTDAGLTVVDGGQGAPVPPCVVLWTTPGEPDAGSLAGPTSGLGVEGTTGACGADSDQALWVADKIQAALSPAVPIIAGRTVHPV